LFNTGGIAFDSAGNLFIAEAYAGANTYKVAPNGQRTLFASGGGLGLACDSAGNLYRCNIDNDYIDKFSPQGTPGVFVSSLSDPISLAFQVPEPSVVATLCLGIFVSCGF